jgi:hypothetical protein
VKETDAMDQFDRLASAGYFVPPDPEGKVGAVFATWFDMVRGYELDDVRDGITALMRTKTDRNWPTPGQLRGAIAGITAGRESQKCRTCHGSGWVTARPYRANAGYIYEGVERCPGCGLPMPKDVTGQHQTPLTDREFADWQKAQRPMRVITSRDELFARIRSVLGSRLVPDVAPSQEVE